MVSNTETFIQVGLMTLLGIVIGLKIWIVWLNYSHDKQEEDLIYYDILFSTVLTICSFLIVAAYIVLYLAFIKVIRSSNGLLEFMRS